jgi:hypothetical protein
LSGLDPADPNFSYQPPEVRLDPSDAVYVDVIHTDGSPYTTYSGKAERPVKLSYGHRHLKGEEGIEVIGIFMLQNYLQSSQGDNSYS